MQRIVVQQYEPYVGRAPECELVDNTDLIVSQQNSRDVLETGKRVLLQRAEWRVLNGQLPEPRQPAERKTLDVVNAVSVQRQLAKVQEPAERVGRQVGQVVFGQRQVFNGLGQIAQWYERQVAGVTENLQKWMVKIKLEK